MMRLLYARVFDNAVLKREIQAGVRATSGALTLFIYVFLVGLFMFACLSRWLLAHDNFSTIQPGTPGLILIYVVGAQMAIIALIIPALMSGLVSGEKERLTFPMLRSSLLNPTDVTMGKLGYGMSIVGVLLVSSLPITVLLLVLIPFNVCWTDFVLCYASLLLFGLLVSEFTLLISARAKRTVAATAQAYGAVLALCAFVYILCPWELAASGYGNVYENIWHPSNPICQTLTLFLAISLSLSIPWMFVCTAHCIEQRATYVLWAQRLFLFWSVAATMLFTLGVVECDFLHATAGRFASLWSGLLLFFLFTQALLDRPPVLPRQRDRLRYSRSWTSRREFFPIYFIMLALLAASILFACGADVMPLYETMATVVTLQLALPVIARGIAGIARRKIPATAIYLGIFSLALIVPAAGEVAYAQLPGNHQMMPLLTFYFVSPYTAVSSIWDTAACQAMSTSFGSIPVWQATIVFYGIATAIMAAAARWLRPKAPRPA